jgi:hypothetical protein
VTGSTITVWFSGAVVVASNNNASTPVAGKVPDWFSGNEIICISCRI